MDAGLEPSIVYEFLETQAQGFREVYLLNKDGLPIDEYIRNEIKYTQVSMLKDLIDDGTYNTVDLASLSEVSLERAREYRDQINTAFEEAGLEPLIIGSFLESQLEVFGEVLHFNKKDLTREEFKKNDAMLLQVFVLKSILKG